LARYYAAYPVHQHRLDFPVLVAYSRRLAQLQKHGLLVNDKILDYGCGNGAFVEFLKSKGYQEATGFDRFVKAFSDPAILACSFHAVVSYDVIEHVEDPGEFMREMISLLNPGGLLVIGTPNAAAVSLECRPFDMELSQPFHRHLLSTKLLLWLGSKEGFVFQHLACRSPFDTLLPGLNTAFLSALIAARGGFLDAAAEPIGLTEVLRHPKLLFSALFGYFAASGRNVVAVFKKPFEPPHSILIADSSEGKPLQEPVRPILV
jgi:SAM-dependent methyltransferase